MRDKLRLVAIIRNVAPSNITAIAEILIEEGIQSVEVSLSEPEKGFACLEILKKTFSTELFIGAGTVTQKAEIDRLISLNVAYFFCAGFDASIVEYAGKSGIRTIPGVLTPSEVQQGVSRGLKLLKLFPANVFPEGYVKDLHGPFPGVEFLAVGGISPDNLGDYLKRGFCGVGIGSSLVPQMAGREHLEMIRKNAKKCAAVLKAHLGAL